MLDLAGAAKAAATLMAGGDQATNADLIAVNMPMVSAKSSWKTQIIGVYDLIFPYMHIDYPLRTEVDMAIYSSFQLHHVNHKHNGKKSKHRGYKNDAVPLSFHPREIFIALAGMARAGSPVNAIGYGLGDNVPGGMTGYNFPGGR